MYRLTKFREYRIRAKLSGTQLAELAKVDRRTAKRAESGQPIRDVQAGKLLEVLSTYLGMPLEFKDIEDLNIV